MRHALPMLVLVPMALTGAPSSAQTATQPPTVELVVSGPQTLPLLARGKSVHFTATLINRSDSSVLILPPHPDWPDERWTSWQATDEKARPIDGVPQEFIWCDPRGTMHAQPVFPGYVTLTLDPRAPRKQITDSDLVLLKPGETYQLPHIGDPRFYLKFRRPGTYRLSLTYDFQPAHYRLPPHSAHSADLAHAPPIGVISRSLELTLE